MERSLLLPKRRRRKSCVTPLSNTASTNVSPFQVRVRAKQNFSPRMAVVIHVTNV
jgi:hypothetical protein